jgi:hypothetical protein
MMSSICSYPGLCNNQSFLPDQKHGGLGRLPKAFWMDWRIWELAALSALAALGCGLAAVQGDLLFVALFAAVTVVTIVETIRRLRVNAGIGICGQKIIRGSPASGRF